IDLSRAPRVRAYRAPARALRARVRRRTGRHRRPGTRQQRGVPALGARRRVGCAPARDRLPASGGAGRPGGRPHLGGDGAGDHVRAAHRDPAGERSPGARPGALAVVSRERPHRATPTARSGAERALLLLAREHPMPPSPAVPDVARVIQLAVAPVFLLSGVGVTLTVLTSRLSRIVDRARSL